MKILVTGGAGFIGSHLVDSMINGGDDIVVVDNFSSGKRRNLNSAAKFFNIDIRDRAISKIFAEEHFDVVFHLAAQTNVLNSIMNPQEDYSVNVEGTINIAESCGRFGVGKIIFTSSVSVYGEPLYLPIDENHSTSPINPYGKNKLAAEEQIVATAKKFGFDFTILRYANVYGPRQTYSQGAGVIAIFMNRMLKLEDIEIFGDGSHVRDFVYVSDVVEATVAAVDKGSGKIINLGTGGGVNINELFEIISSLTNYKKSPIYRKRREGEVNMSYVQTEKAKEVLGFESQWALEEGLREMLPHPNL